MYHAPDGVMSACCQSLSSLALVPDSSAREANGDVVLAIALMACSMPSALAVLAGSDGGPTKTKSVCITARRGGPWPSFMNVCSAAGEWTSSTSAWPRAPRSSACPEPTATVLTLQSLAFSNAGTSVSSSPVSRVLVVVARIVGPLAAVVLLDEPESQPQPANATIAAASSATGWRRAVISPSFVLRSR